jgi:hypothetical protein
MKTFYTAYTKSINGTTFYFIKTYQTFPEFKNVSPVLETYGMHTNFKKACKIAQVDDPELQKQLLNEIENKAAACKVIPLQNATTKIYNLKRRHTIFPSFLKLIGLG